VVQYLPLDAYDIPSEDRPTTFRIYHYDTYTNIICAISLDDEYHEKNKNIMKNENNKNETY